MPVRSVEKLEKDIDLVYMANSYVNTIYSAIKNGISKDRMIIENAILYKDYCQVEGMADISYDYVMAEQYEKYITKPKYVVTSTMLKDMKIYNGELQTEGEMAVIVSRDYCRYATLELLIEQIREESVQGSLAELGVFRGDFSKFLNREFPERKLYLFDTFEGFDKRDVKHDLDERYSSEQWFDLVENFGNTNEDDVMAKMRYPSNVIIRKGYFPETIPQEEVDYALVSIDCDLYVPILEGLRYFYPRLKMGGIL